MSITPYNNFTVRDLSGVQQPYVNSTTEVGYFSGDNLGTISQNKWYSLPAVLTTKNGIANVDASGVRILNPGIYSIKLSVFPITTEDGSSNISFNFGTSYLFDVLTNVSTDAFGGVQPSGMFTYAPLYNSYTPGIISWVATGYSSGNNTMSNFLVNPSTYELSYNYYNAGYPTTKALYSGICTTETTFILDYSATIFFNVSTNSSTGVTMGNCSFTLQLISTNHKDSTPTWRVIQSNAPNRNWTYGCLSSSKSGKFSIAVGGEIYVSKNYGVNWTQVQTAQNWLGVTSDSTGRYLVAVGVNIIKTSSDFGDTWNNITPPLSGKTWAAVASSSNAEKIFIVSSTAEGSIWKSENFGVNWISTNASGSIAWNKISSDRTGTNLMAVGNGNLIWRSTDSGVSWIQSSSFPSVNIFTISISSNGNYLYVAGDQVQLRLIVPSTTWETIKPIPYPGAIDTGNFELTNSQYVYCGGYNSKLFFSNNYGESFAPISNSITNWITAITTSNNGSLAITANANELGSDGSIYVFYRI